MQIHRGKRRFYSPTFDTEREAEQWKQQQLQAISALVRREPVEPVNSELVEQPAEQPPGEPIQPAKGKPVEQPADQPPRKVSRTSEVRAAEENATEQGVIAQVRAAEENAKQLREELGQTKRKLAWQAARIAELEDQNDWFHAAACARLQEPATLLRRTEPRNHQR